MCFKKVFETLYKYFCTSEDFSVEKTSISNDSKLFSSHQLILSGDIPWNIRNHIIFILDMVNDDICVLHAQNVLVKIVRIRRDRALLLRAELIRHGGMVSENNLSKSRTAVKIAVNSKPSADA